MTEKVNMEGQESGLQLHYAPDAAVQAGTQDASGEKKGGKSRRRPASSQPKGEEKKRNTPASESDTRKLAQKSGQQGKEGGKRQKNPDHPDQGSNMAGAAKGSGQGKKEDGRQNSQNNGVQESKKSPSGENRNNKSRRGRKAANSGLTKSEAGLPNSVKSGNSAPFSEENTAKTGGKQQYPLSKAFNFAGAAQNNSVAKQGKQKTNNHRENSGRGKKKLDVAQVMSNLQYPQFDSIPETVKDKKRGGGKLSIIPLGGLGEIGKNMTAIRYGDVIIVIDGGMAFPDDDLLGIDLVIPDYSYLLENRDLVKAIVLTHGHEDHIGAIPYILKDMKVPIYGGKLTLGLLAQKFKEHHLSDISMNVVEPRNIIPIGSLKLEFIRVAHSIPDSMAVAIHTPIGVILHTGDFKMDMSPVAGEPMDYRRLAALGDKGVLLMLSDSTNVEREGYTASEKTIGQSLENIFRSASGRIILTTFASNVHRVQQAIWAAEACGRKVAVVGRGMCNVVSIATEMGYLTFGRDTMIEVEEVNRYPADQVLIITTGSQGEQLAGLTRMSLDEHRQVRLLPGDMVVISANPIPGNELLVSKTIDNLYRHGTQVIYGSSWGVHVSGHASSEELKLMLNLARPRFFIPAHGEYRMLYQHAMLAQKLGMNKDNIFIMENGQVLEVSRYKAKLSGKVQSGRVLVDGFGVGDVGASVLKDRKQLANEGIVIVALVVDDATGTITVGPEILTKGFVFEKENDHLLDEAKGKVLETFNTICKDYCDVTALKSGIRSTLGRFFYDHIGRRPIVMPMVMIIS